MDAPTQMLGKIRTLQQVWNKRSFCKISQVKTYKTIHSQRNRKNKRQKLIVPVDTTDTQITKKRTTI